MSKSHPCLANFPGRPGSWIDSAVHDVVHAWTSLTQPRILHVPEGDALLPPTLQIIRPPTFQIILSSRLRLVNMGRTLKRKACSSPVPTQDYDELERRLAEEGEIRTHRPSTRRSLADEWSNWEL